MDIRFRRFLSTFAAAAAILGAACAQETAPLQPPTGTALDGGVTVDRGPEQCKQTEAAALPARLEAIYGEGDAGSDAGAMSGTTYFSEDLYGQFVTICGHCHGSEQNQGGFQVKSVEDLEAALTNSSLNVLGRITSNGGTNDPEAMPPKDATFVPYSNLPLTDPLKQFGELLTQWVSLKEPPSFQYTLPTSSSGSTSGGSALPIPDVAVGNAMTNIGNCVPTAGLMYADMGQAQQMDQLFAAALATPVAKGGTPVQAIGLPVDLSDTDLTTFDSATLAKSGVIAYAPNYPLWTDNAGKLRYVRVPVGTSIAFDKATQSFTIPPNTRFYKTFMKQVVDTDGSLRWRKIETRLIVSRPDVLLSNGTYQPTALYGTYKWTDDETGAKLEQTKLNDEEPFADDMLQYDTDEGLAADLLKGNPTDPEATLISYGADRHYAVPGSVRCVQCHEGSESHSFVLGFLPLQINRRPTGIGGTIEPTGPDELNQLQRFIDYGVITGINSPADILPLEQAEGTRTPRNDHELVAQGYMLGNCAHCHNPGGFPSQQNPVLVNILNFYPSPIGGIFQFPLEQTSPRIFRGAAGNGPIPYITPSLVDQPRDDGSSDEFLQAFGSGNSALVSTAWYAPWRSLIYRNTDNPFAYTDDSALFPHMPMNIPSYDPRARQVLSDWMVSIPAVRKSADTNEYAVIPGGGLTGVAAAPPAFGGKVDTNVQPFTEVFPGDPRYAQALSDASARLDILHSGINPQIPLVSSGGGYLSRYADPADPGDDIVNPSLAGHACNVIPQPGSETVGQATISSQIPGHCDWVITDTTISPGAWIPRRPDWGDILVELTPEAPPVCAVALADTQAQVDAAAAVRLLQTVTLPSDAEAVNPTNYASTDYLVTEAPFGLWQQKSGCSYPSQNPVSHYQTGPATEPMWMAYAADPRHAPLNPNAPVYMSTPGEAVFKAICINCHGPIGDATGRLATNLATMTGGQDLVADFRDGLFGPVASPPQYAWLHQEFDTLHDSNANIIQNAPESWLSTTPFDRAARYMSWMALGGTQVTIPAGLLTIVGETPVLGTSRSNAPNPKSANMLSTAKAMCDRLLGVSASDEAAQGKLSELAQFPFDGESPAVLTNGDGELWLRLCAFNNPPPIHVIQNSPTFGGLILPGIWTDSGNYSELPNGRGGLLIPSAIANQQPIGNERGDTVPYDPTTNLYPWCAITYAGAAPLPANTPMCPDSIFTAANEVSADAAEDWSVRGAINAGLSVFLYMRDMETRGAPPPDYNQCEQLQ